MIYHDQKEIDSSKNQNQNQIYNSGINMVETSSNKITSTSYDVKKTEYISTNNKDSREILVNNTYQRTSYRKNSPK